MLLSEQVWVLTGAAGKVGSVLREGLHSVVGSLRLLDLAPINSQPGDTATTSATVDVTELAALEEQVAGADGVVHLAAIADEADFTTWSRSMSWGPTTSLRPHGGWGSGGLSTPAATG